MNLGLTRLLRIAFLHKLLNNSLLIYYLVLFQLRVLLAIGDDESMMSQDVFKSTNGSVVSQFCSMSLPHCFLLSFFSTELS